MDRLIRRAATLACGAALVLSAPVAAHDPGTDGGPADRACKPVSHRAIYVGATRVSCKVARRVVRAARRGDHPAHWRCGRAKGKGFGHCHGTGRYRGAIAHWAVND